jgi:hypothetical protein
MKNHAKRDWRKYNRKLVNRGSITLWLEEETLASWVEKSGKRGRPSFAKAVIQAGWVLKTVYRLPLRALQGFLDSLLRILKTNLTAPHYSLFCKRANEASSILPKLSHKRPTELAIDSSGLKISGEGEWKVKIHGTEKRRGWIKVHIGVDPRTQDLIVAEVTNDKVGDSTALPLLVSKAPKSIRKVLADGAYDTLDCRRYLANKNIEECIPPQRNGRLRKEHGYEERNTAITLMSFFGGGAEAHSLWKKLMGYHKRSLAETAFSRLKRLFGERLSCKKFTNLKTETLFRCHALNKMNSI